MLRVLQERELTRVGGNEIVKFDVRVIVATHRNLAEEVKSGNFREDLFYRLLGIPIELPALRDRDKDILLIAKHMLAQFAKENSLGKITLTKEAQTKLMSYSFPGNVRELKSITELAAVMCEENVIDVDDISFNTLQKEGEFLFQEMTLKEYTFKIIRHFLNKYDNNVIKVAQKLDIGKSSIYRYLKEMEEDQ